MSKKKALILSVLLVSLVLAINHRVNAPASSLPFYLVIGNGGALAVQNTQPRYVTFSVTNGTLNSSSSRVNMGLYSGYLSMNSSSIFTVNVNASADDLRLTSRVNQGSWNPIASGNDIISPANSHLTVRWYIAIYDPFEDYSMLGIGVSGIILLCFSCFYTARTFREIGDIESPFKLGWGMLGIIIGCGLLIVWLW